MNREFPIIEANPTSIAGRDLVYGVGINDAGYLTQPIVDGIRMRCPFYQRWRAMLTRCYSSKYHKRFPTYTGCSVCREWLTFSNFKKWMEEQKWEGNELDKDILIEGNKVYSPATCVFVSPKLNSLLNDCGAARGRYPKGVSYNKEKNKYISQCNIDGKRKHLGCFDSVEEALVAYQEAKSDYVRKMALTQNGFLRNALLRIAVGMVAA